MSSGSGGRRVLSLNASFSDIAQLLRLLVLSLCTLALLYHLLWSRLLLPACCKMRQAANHTARSEFETVEIIWCLATGSVMDFSF
eukprot:COSAG02_NODE_1872_length_10579_cov_4.937405_7_plen_85_part_00